MTQALRAVDVTGPHRWWWVLTAGSGQVLADRQVDLDVDTAEYEAFCDLVGHLDRHRLPHDPAGSEAEAVERRQGGRGRERADPGVVFGAPALVGARAAPGAL